MSDQEEILARVRSRSGVPNRAPVAPVTEVRAPRRRWWLESLATSARVGIVAGAGLAALFVVAWLWVHWSDPAVQAIVGDIPAGVALAGPFLPFFAIAGLLLLARRR